MVDVALAHLAEAQQAGQDRQPGRVGRCPALRAQLVVGQLPARAGPGMPLPAAGLTGGECLVQPAGLLVDHDGVPVAVGRAAALDLGVATERVAPLVALAGIAELHLHLGVLAPDHGDGDAVVDRRLAVGRPEVRVQPRAGRHVGEPLGAAGVDGQLADIGVPIVVGGKTGQLVCGRWRVAPSAGAETSATGPAASSRLAAAISRVLMENLSAGGKCR